MYIVNIYLVSCKVIVIINHSSQLYDEQVRVIHIVYRPGYFTVHHPPPTPAPSGPKFSNSENCCGSENAMPPKFFWDMMGHRDNFWVKKRVFFL